MIDLDPELHKTLITAYKGNPPKPSEIVEVVRFRGGLVLRLTDFCITQL